MWKSHKNWRSTFAKFNETACRQTSYHKLYFFLIPSISYSRSKSSLVNPINLKEVEIFVKSIYFGKYLMNNGFMWDLFQIFWHIVRVEVWKAVKDTYFRWHIHAFNSSFFTIIPKEHDLESIKKFWPISLCNSIYKIILIIIYNSFKPILHKIISLK